MTEVLTSRAGAVLTITLNRPDVYNAINRALHEGLAAALADASDPAIRAVVLTGAGRGVAAAAAFAFGTTVAAVTVPAVPVAGTAGARFDAD